MNHVSIKKQASIRLSWVEWQLYDMKGSIQAAEAINDAIETAFNEGSSRKEISKIALSVMGDFDQFGADDTDPRDVLDDVLDELYR